MGIGVAPEEVLPQDHLEALYAGLDMLADECFEDLIALSEGESFSNTGMAGCLPPKYLPRYDYRLAKQFLTCVLTVAWKLRSPEIYRHACVGEELALRAIVDKAKLYMEMKGQKADYDTYETCAFEDLAF